MKTECCVRHAMGMTQDKVKIIEEKDCMFCDMESRF